MESSLEIYLLESYLESYLLESYLESCLLETYLESCLLENYLESCFCLMISSGSYLSADDFYMFVCCSVCARRKNDFAQGW